MNPVNLTKPASAPTPPSAISPTAAASPTSRSRPTRELPRQELGGQGGPHRVAPHRHLPGRPGGDAGEARQEGPAWSTSRVSCRPASGVRTARTATASRPRSCWSPAAECNFSISRTVTAHRRRTATPCRPPKPPRRWMTARSPSKLVFFSRRCRQLNEGRSQLNG